MDDNDKKELIKGLFDRVAATYNTVGPRFFSYFGRRLAEQAMLRQGMKVLDIACGRGALLFEARELIGESGEAVGIDLSSAMVSETTREILRRSLSNVKAVRMDAEHLYFPGGYFDRALCGFCLFFFQEPEVAVKEIFRVLKPGGAIALSTWGKYDTRDWHIEIAKKYIPAAPNQPKLVDRKFDEPEEVIAVLKTAGFTLMKFVEENKEFLYASEEEWWATQNSHGIRATLEAVEKAAGKDGLERFKVEAMAHLNKLKTSDGYRQSMRVFYFIASKP